MTTEPMIIDGEMILVRPDDFEFIPETRRLVLPLPPSVNGYWTRGKQWNGKKSMVRTDRAQSFLAKAIAAIRLQGSPSFGAHPFVVSIQLHCREGYTEGDIDNYNKGLLDACTYAGVWDDDDQVIDINPKRRGVVKGGGAILDIRAATDREIEETKTVNPDINKLWDWGLQ